MVHTQVRKLVGQIPVDSTFQASKGEIPKLGSIEKCIQARGPLFNVDKVRVRVEAVIKHSVVLRRVVA